MRMNNGKYIEKYDSIVDRLFTNVTFVNGKKSISKKCMWDTGAQVTFISQNIVDELMLEPCGTSKFSTIDAEKDVEQYRITIILPNAAIIPEQKVNGYDTKKFEADAIIGMDIISHLNLTIDNSENETKFIIQSIIE